MPIARITSQIRLLLLISRRLIALVCVLTLPGEQNGKGHKFIYNSCFLTIIFFQLFRERYCLVPFVPPVLRIDSCDARPFCSAQI